MPEKTMRRLAKPMLLMAALIWGSSFFIMKNTVDAIEPLFLLAIRFSIGTVLMGLLCWKKWKNLTRDYFWRGAIIGGCLFLAYTIQTMGLQYTTPSNNAFLTAVYCVLVPFLCWLVVKRKPDIYNVLAAVLCVAGIGFVSLTEQFTIQIGDTLTLVAAVLYAAHIVAVEKYSPGKDIYLITTFQFFYAAVYSWLGVAVTDCAPAVVPGEVWTALLYLGVMCTTVALLFQNVGQIYSDPASASVLLSLESVFGVLFSVALYGDPITGRLLLGFALIFVAILCSETKFSFLRKKEQRKAES